MKNKINEKQDNTRPEEDRKKPNTTIEGKEDSHVCNCPCWNGLQSWCKEPFR